MSASKVELFKSDVEKPVGWEGLNYPKTLEGFAHWLSTKLNLIRSIRDNPLYFQPVSRFENRVMKVVTREPNPLHVETQIAVGRLFIRNAYCWLDSQQFTNRPNWDRTDTADDVERQLERLLSWTREQLQTGLTKVASKDGPLPPNQFWWNGEMARLAPIPWKLLDCMWGKESISIDRIMQCVWGNDNSESGLKTALSRLKKSLLSAGYPRHLREKNGQIYWDG